MAFVLPALSAIGEAAGTAGSAIGSGLASAGGAVEGALGNLGAASGLSNIAEGIGGLLGGGAPSEAGYLASLGQAVPEGVELAGPSSTFTGPGFFGGLMQGIEGTAQKLADPSASTQIGTGLGQFFNALDQIRGAGNSPGAAARQIVNLAQSPTGPATKVTPPAPVVHADTGPIMKLIGQIFAGL